jgi:NADPH:quinone reductase-like Zn-dependent oxidoreductase
MKAARFSNFGTPTEVIQVVEEEEPGPLEPGEALLEVLATPIHPSDLATIAGFYGLLPKLPAVPGNEGVGRVLRVEGDASVKPGDLVFLPMSNGGSWRERMKAKAQRLLPVPPGADLHQMAMVSANPPSAELLLREFGKPQPGEWVIQNAANSAVGRYLITLAKREGIKTVNVVRRAGLADELKALGADVVLEDEPGLEQQIRDVTGGASIRLAFDAVGGSSTLLVHPLAGRRAARGPGGAHGEDGDAGRGRHPARAGGRRLPAGEHPGGAEAGDGRWAPGQGVADASEGLTDT